MSLRAGARTVVDQCLKVQEDERVVLVNDGNDPNLVEALMNALDGTAEYRYMEYEPGERSGEEPPAEVAEALKESDVFIAPTRKSISQTKARRAATDSGSRGATMPGVDAEMWGSSLLADYEEVARRCRDVYSLLSGVERITVETPSGTALELEVVQGYYQNDTGLIHEPGEFGNLPAGEVFGAPVNASGTLVIDHFPHAPEGTRVEIEDNRVVAVEHPGNEESELAEAFEGVDGARNVAELGIGTNPEAELIGKTLQDEKVLGTVHVAFGDNSSMVPEGDRNRVAADVHWDVVCENPTLRFDDEKVIDAGEPLFV